MAGRPPKPISVLKLEGGFRRDRHAHREHEPRAPGELGPAPDWMNPEQQALWDELAAAAPAVLHRADRPLFAGYVVLVGHLQGVGGVPIADPGMVRSTVLAIAKVGSELGMSPIARAKLGTSIEPEPENEFEKLDLILPDGRRVPYAERRAGGRLRT